MVWIHPRDLAKQRKIKQQERPIFPKGAKFKHWEECAQAFLAQFPSVAATRRNYSFLLRSFFGRDPKKTPNDYRKVDVERWLIEPTQDGEHPSASLYNCKLTALSSFYKYASDYEYEFRGGWRHLLTRQPPTLKIKRRRDTFRSRAFTDDELTRFFEAIEQSTSAPLIKKRNRALFLLYLWTARRCREIADLLWGDIECKKIHGHEIWLYHWRGKGHTSKDDVAEIPVNAVVALREYLEADGRWGNLKPSDPLFPGQWGEEINPATIRHYCKQYTQLAGIRESGTHRFRHTRAVATYEEMDNDIVAVSELLRHSSIDMTRRYVTKAQSQIDKTAPRLRNRFGHL